MSENRFLLLFICALIIPPVSVVFTNGLGLQLALNIVLTLFGWFPGVIHAMILLTMAERSGAETKRAVNSDDSNLHLPN